MTVLNPVRTHPMAPEDQDACVARQSRAALASLLRSDGGARLHVHAEGKPQVDIVLPLSIAPLLLGALEEIGKGNGVTLLPTDAELTTQQAADLARVSRPFFVKLLEEGKIPFRMVGAHRRILYRDMAHFIAEEEARRVQVMEELVAETERLGLYE